jgi:hypothetical protein
MKPVKKILNISILLLLTSCITQFIPRTNEDKKILVVEGLITDQPDINTVKLSKSLPLGTRNSSTAVTGSIVSISDDLGNTYDLNENEPGTYVTDPSKFQGVIGRFYILHIRTNEDNVIVNYESVPTEMKPVPPIDSVYYEKVTLKETNGIINQQGCQIFLSTQDPANQTKFYRWEYKETWEFHLPYIYPQNRICWLSDNSSTINVKNTSFLTENRIDRYPLNFISNLSDRLAVRYSILVNQYSLNEDEFTYWDKLRNITEEVGGLYDIIPSSVPSNVYCIDDPNAKVLGYFSVSASASKRIFIKDRFSGLIDQYTNCIDDTIYSGESIPNLDLYSWIIIVHTIPPPSYNIITKIKGCADCSVRGTIIKPDFWNEEK